MCCAEESVVLRTKVAKQLLSISNPVTTSLGLVHNVRTGERSCEKTLHMRFRFTCAKKVRTSTSNSFSGDLTRVEESKVGNLGWVYFRILHTHSCLQLRRRKFDACDRDLA